MSIIKIVETERLLVRPWSYDDFEDFFKIMADPLTHKYIGSKPWDDIEFKSFIKWCESSEMGINCGFGRGYFNCPLVLKSENKVIGRVGLNPFYKEECIPEIEWTIGPDYWQKGYGTEIGKEILRYGTEELGFKKIVGFTSPTNIGSNKVMENIGMKFEGKKIINESIPNFYSFEL